MACVPVPGVGDQPLQGPSEVLLGQVRHEPGPVLQAEPHLNNFLELGHCVTEIRAAM
jgi:hypothetical protein